MKAVFLGTPEIAVKPLEYLCAKNDVEICAIVTQPDRPSGRGHKLTPPPVKVKAEELGINVFQTVSIRKDSDLIEKLKSLNADFFHNSSLRANLESGSNRYPEIRSHQPPCLATA